MDLQTKHMKRRQKKGKKKKQIEILVANLKLLNSLTSACSEKMEDSRNWLEISSLMRDLSNSPAFSSETTSCYKDIQRFAVLFKK